MIDFKQAISTAQDNLQALQPDVQDVRLEAAMLNRKGRDKKDTHFSGAVF